VVDEDDIQEGLIRECLGRGSNFEARREMNFNLYLGNNLLN
jgi:hypothetical protein